MRKKGCIIYNPLKENLPFADEEKSKYVVTIGRLTEQKNHKLLISAFEKFVQNHPNHELRIYGNGPLKAELENFAKGLGISDKVRLMGAVENVTEHIKDAEMFVLSSDFEGMPNVLAEAMAMGLPCVSTDCLGGGAAALVENEKNGLLIPCRDVEQLYNAMERIVSDVEFSDKIASNGKLLIDQLSVENITSQWLDYCQNLL